MMSDQIISRVLSRLTVTPEAAMIIPLGQQLPAASSDTTRERRAGYSCCSPIWSCSGWGLPSFPGHPGNWWALTSPFHPYPRNAGGIFSVALSLGLPPVAVSDHPALWSSDFPPVRKTGPAIIW